MDVRPPREEDEPFIRRLLLQLGYDIGAEQLRLRLAALADSASDAVLVATSGDGVVGVIALHWSAMLQHAVPVCRITTLVVDEAARGQGVGHLLVGAAVDRAEQAGCEALELTTALHRVEAHAFYRALGFTNSALKFGRALDSVQP